MKKDKLYHVLAGLATAFVGIPVYQFTYNAATDTYLLAPALWATIVSGILLGLCKEFFDMQTEGNKWDWLDFGCTCIGAVIVAVFIICLHYGKG